MKISIIVGTPLLLGRLGIMHIPLLPYGTTRSINAYWCPVLHRNRPWSLWPIPIRRSLLPSLLLEWIAGVHCHLPSPWSGAIMAYIRYQYQVHQSPCYTAPFSPEQAGLWPNCQASPIGDNHRSSSCPPVFVSPSLLPEWSYPGQGANPWHRSTNSIFHLPPRSP